MEEPHKPRPDTPFGWLAALLAALKRRGGARKPEAAHSPTLRWVTRKSLSAGRLVAG